MRAATFLLALAIAACAAPREGGGRLVVLAPPDGLAESMTARVGKDFALAEYPERARTLEEVYGDLSAGHSVATLLRRWRPVYATQFPATLEGSGGPIYVFAATPAFTGDVVYAVSVPWPAMPRKVYVFRGR